MTIGIGFKCVDGLVIAADTRYTQGSIKSHGPKIFPLFAPVTERPDLAVVIAGAGTVPFMKRAVEKIEAALAGCSDPTLEDVRTIAEDALLQFYQTHIYPSPASAQRGFELILGVWTKIDGFGLFKSADTIITPVVKHGTGFCSIGMGQYVSEYALGLTYQPGLNVENAKFIATLCIKAAKDYVDYCGDETRIWTIKDTPPFRMHRVIPPEVKEAEQYSEDLFGIVQDMINFLDTEGIADDTSVAWMTDYLKDSVIKFRQKQRERKERIKKAREKSAKVPTSGGDPQ